MAQMQQAQQGGPQEQPHQTETLQQVQLMHSGRQQQHQIETLEQVQLMHSGRQQQHQIETLEQVQLHLTRQQEQTMMQKDCWRQQPTIAKRQRQKLHCC